MPAPAPGDASDRVAPSPAAAGPDAGTGPTAQTGPRRLWAPRAWLPGGWRTGVLLSIGADGHWSAVQPGVAEPPPDAERLPGPLLPGLVDAHSHAFQRAFAGLAERREQDGDDFWGWRDRMYRVAGRITPPQLEAVAAQLYLELLRGGYTQVCEFHYLQHDTDGRRYADPLRLGWALADAAAAAGIGLTLMPVLYERAGFGAPALREDQRRFAADADAVWALRGVIEAAGRPGLDAGVAIHSLRAAAPASIQRLRRLAEGWAGPIHVHVAEQIAEVEDCLAATGRRPIDWLAAEGLLDARWQLVHATHTVPAEIDAVAAAGAGMVICPTTEANLGDGFADVPGWWQAGVPLAIGSDSHVGRHWPEELRWLDYGQRLRLRQRNLAAAPQAGQPSSAGRLFDDALRAGGRAAGRAHWGLLPGARADALVVDRRSSHLLGVPDEALLDAVVFSSPGRPWRDVMVAGRWVVRDHRHPAAAAIAQAFAAAMDGLWGG
ncbi:formimidoylglutamate deiminase [Piscinibacter sakaiensis]|uniref:formimidoylglutamate deiminase n=1 Tax=Piscinibacter sakaiensis TaxID=1547922 RepID=UPI000A599873|nr:formimidoylglutamate deiminase [Piscinibacter sakaiensis]